MSRSKVGKLKIFLGMAAGVGKTYTMLEEAHKKVNEGFNVLVGIVNTHGRADTAKLLVGLKGLPEKEIKYKTIILKELDLDAILEKKPDLVLVDELAHTNAPSMRHPKRWQDVIEILDAGIDVYSTLNVQHLESYKEIVEVITSITISETVPDFIIDRAESVELVDLTPQELIERLKEGKVYTGELSRIAIENFFQEAKLTALREIALRLTAEKVEHELHRMISKAAREKGWKPRERFMALIDHTLESAELVRRTSRLAFHLDAPWIALHINTGIPLDEKQNLGLSKNLELANDLGGAVLTINHPDVIKAIELEAAKSQVTQLVINKPTSKKWKRFISKLEDINILIIPPNPLITKVKKRKNPFSKLWQKARYQKEFFFRREESTRLIFAILQDIAMAPTSKELFGRVKERLDTILNGTVEILIRKIDNGVDLQSLGDEKEQSVAAWALKTAMTCGFSTTTLPFAKNLYIPLKGFTEVLGVLTYKPQNNKPLLPEEKSLLYTIAGQLGSYLERIFTEEKKRSAYQREQIEHTYQRILKLISEEFKNPVSKLNATISELKKNQQPEVIVPLENSLMSLNAILGNLSAMVALVEGFFTLHIEPNSIEILISHTVNNLRKIVGNHNLVIKIDPSLKTFPFDFSLMSLLLTNLLTNAATYSPHGTTIEIATNVKESYFLLSVSDEGPGIPEDLLEKVFERFYRLPDAPIPGLGLGLPIAKTIAEIHEGTLRAQNKEVKGAIFTLILPIK